MNAHARRLRAGAGAPPVLIISPAGDTALLTSGDGAQCLATSPLCVRLYGSRVRSQLRVALLFLPLFSDEVERGSPDVVAEILLRLSPEDPHKLLHLIQHKGG